MYFNVYEFYGDVANDLFSEDFGIDISIFKISIITEPEEFDIRLLHESYRISQIITESYGGEIKDRLNDHFFKVPEQEDEELKFLKVANIPYSVKLNETIVAEVDVINDNNLLTSFMTLCEEYNFSNITKH